MKKLFSLLLVLSMLLVVFAACGDKDETQAPTTAAPTTGSTAQPTTEPTTEPTAPPPTTPEATTTPEPTTTSKWAVIAPQISALSADDRTLNFSLSDYYDSELTSMSKEYVAGPDALDGSQSELETKVYNRNRAAMDMMGITINYSYTTSAWGKGQAGISDACKNTQLTGEDKIDLWSDMIYDLGGSTMDASFRDVVSMKGDYFDFSADGWMYELMTELAVVDDRMYILASDYFIDVYRSMSVLPFNLTMMDENGAKLGPILTDDYDDGVAASEFFFDLVRDGAWTYDYLRLLSEAIWDDTNGDEADDIGDRLGFISNTGSGMPATLILYSAGITTVVEGTDAEGKLTLTYPTSNTDMQALITAIDALFAATGTFANTGGLTDDVGGFARLIKKFADQEALFAGANVLGVLEDPLYQGMTDTFSVVPMPKVDNSTGRKYQTVIHNIGNAGAINILSTKYVALSAYLQYVTENSNEVIEEYLDTTMKFQITDFVQGTADMLEIIYDSIGSIRDKSLEDIMHRVKGIGNHRFHFLVNKNAFQPASSFATAYEEAIGFKQAKLDELIADWYKLPVATE